MSDFRYSQFCPLARATEILGERWTLLVVRELLLGPQRFSDLRRRLPGVSTSVLSARVRTLEERGVVLRRQLPPPAGSSVIELTPLGLALRDSLIALSRWGLNFMGTPIPGDHYEPSWMRLGLAAFASHEPGPARRFEIRLPDVGGDVVIHVEGGPGGTRVADAAQHEPDATIRGEALPLFALITGAVDAESSIASGSLEIGGDRAAVADLPALFSLPAPPVDMPSGPPS